MAWNSALPVSGSKELATPSIFQSNWVAMNGILGMEHYDMTETLSGRHQPGQTGAMYVSANANIAALSSPVTGALSWVTDTGSGMGLLRGTSNWKKFNSDLPTTRVDAYSSSLTLSAGNYSLHLSGGSEILDTMGEWNTTTGVFSACEAGYFLCISTLTLSSTLSGGNSVTFGFSGSGINESRTFTTDPSGCMTQSMATLVSSGPNVTICPFVVCSNSSLYVSGGDGITYCKIYRTS